MQTYRRQYHRICISTTYLTAYEISTTFLTCQTAASQVGIQDLRPANRKKRISSQFQLEDWQSFAGRKRKNDFQLQEDQMQMADPTIEVI